MFESPFNKPQNNSIFSSPFSNSHSNDSLDNLYRELETLKLANPQQQTQTKTVFTEIADEMKNVSDDERRFIETSPEYIAASNEYQTGFSMFLVEQFGDAFLKSKYGMSTEKSLAVIRQKKEEYKNRFAADISNIRDQNELLVQKNDELARTNQELQKQLLEIRNQLGGMKNAN